MTEKNNFGIYPPWVTLNQEMKALFGTDPNVCVGDVMAKSSGVYGIQIKVNYLKQAEAMSAMLNKKYDFGGTFVEIDVVDEDGNPVKEATGEDGDLILLIFENNTRFYSMAIGQAGYAQVVYCIFTQELIQFENDNYLSYANYKTELNSDVAQKIIRGTRVSFCEFVTGKEINK